MFNVTGLRYSSIEACREKTGLVDILRYGKVVVAANKFGGVSPRDILKKRTGVEVLPNAQAGI